jgi:protein-S-isoprenylcysteine O-methyltransferase Ste14
MSKILKTFVSLIIMYLIPLIGNTGLLLNTRIILLMVASIIMLITQPEMKVSEAKEKHSTDRNSIFIILIAGALSQILTILEWRFTNAEPAIVHNSLVVTIGFVMLFGGLAFRYWAIRTLNIFFTATVQVKTGHKVIQNGPYKIVRHPSYLGALVAIVGAAVVLEAPLSAMFAFVAMTIAYIIRIGVEEIALVNELGNDYREFQKTRKYKVIPLVW